MSTPNPLAPQGSLLEKQAKSKSSLHVAALIVGLHVVVLGGFLFLGCKREDTKLPDTTPTTDTFTNSVPLLPDTNAPVTGALSTNGLGIGAAPLGSNLPPLGGYTNADPTPAPAPVVPEPVPAATSASEYKIQKGDIAYNLAKKHGVTLKALKEANPNVDLAKLKVGQTIQIPASSGTAAMASHKPTEGASDSTATGETTVYTVKGGDNLLKIAKRHGTTVKAIRAANGLKSNDIKVGQKLKLPGKASEAAPTTPATSPAPASSVPAATPVLPAPATGTGLHQ